MSAPAAELVVAAPGVYDLPADVYHADPVPAGSLSSSGARRLLPPSCPALFRHEQNNPQAPKRDFDFGHAAHQLVLGVGPVLVVVDAADWRTNAAKAARDEAYAAGAVPLLPHEHGRVVEMATALAAHPLAGRLLQPGSGQAERSLFWVDPATEVWCRARPDWLPEPGSSRMIMPDYKTCRSAATDAVMRAVAEYGYHQQADWYLAGARALGLAGDDAAFVFICQEKTAPYLVNVVGLDITAQRIAKERNRRAIDRYLECVTTGRWPGYGDDVETIALPVWAERQHEEQEW